MADDYKLLAQTLLAVDPATTQIYEVPAGKQAIIKHISVVNVDEDDNVKFRLWQGGTGDANRITPYFTLVRGDESGADFIGTMTMDAADTLHGTSDKASSIIVSVHGDEVT